MSRYADRFRRRLAQFEVSCYLPPDRTVEIAEERTEGMVSMFFAEARGGQKWMDDLRTLARSCYLQGVNDAAIAMARIDALKAKEKG